MTSTDVSEGASGLSLPSLLGLQSLKWLHQKQRSRTCQRYSRCAFFLPTLLFANIAQVELGESLIARTEALGLYP